MANHSEEIDRLNNFEDSEIKDLEELRDRAIEIKTKLGLPSLDTALLMLIHEELDVIAFNNP